MGNQPVPGVVLHKTIVKNHLHPLQLLSHSSFNQQVIKQQLLATPASALAILKFYNLFKSSVFVFLFTLTLIIMPTLLTRKKDNLQEQAQPCNFSDAAQNELIEMPTSLEELRKRCARYEELLSSLQPPQGNSMIRAANFTTDSVLKLVQQSPASSFIRVYYGIDERGKHLLFMAPVKQDGMLAAEEDTIYADDCCACPPRLNCPPDELLEWPS